MRISFLWRRRPVRAHERQHSRGQLPPAPASGSPPARGNIYTYRLEAGQWTLFSRPLLQRSSCLFDVRGLNGPEIVGCDPRLNADAEEITRFFISHLKKPSACMRRTPRPCVDRILTSLSQASKSAFKELTKSVNTTLQRMPTVEQFGDDISTAP